MLGRLRRSRDTNYSTYPGGDDMNPGLSGVDGNAVPTVILADWPEFAVPPSGSELGRS